MKESKKIKLIVWDLDNTVWCGVLSENENVTLRSGIKVVMDTLDKRGILQSISSKNNHNCAINKLEEFGIAHYFLYPKINWNPKSDNIRDIVKQINISQDTVAFIDDQAFEREEVKFSLPNITVYPAEDIENILLKDCMNPNFITEDSRLRRSMYQNEIKRREEELEFVGTKEDFLSTSRIKIRISPAREGDLQRAEELTVRTHQLNSTGYTYSYQDLCKLVDDDAYKIWIVEMSDKYGSYGKIGLVLIHINQEEWIVKLLLTSCRVMSYGIGSLLLSKIINKSLEERKDLLAEFIQTDRNRIMFVTYSMMGFQEIGSNGNAKILKCTAREKHRLPEFMEIIDETLKESI